MILKHYDEIVLGGHNTAFRHDLTSEPGFTTTAFNGQAT